MALGAVALAAAGVLAVGSPPGQGTNMTAYTRDAYASSTATQALDRVRDDGMRQVAIVVTWYMTSSSDSAVARDPALTPSDAAVSRLAQEAHDRGLQVLIKPQVDVRDGTFRGDVQPLNRAAWFASYTAMIAHYATLADRVGADAMTVGVELGSLSADEPAFDRVISAARLRFGGTLTYAANWDEVEQVPFWNDLDAIGVDAYYPLARVPGATETQLESAWKPLVARLGRLSRASDRPVMLTELGYAARPDAAVDPSGAGGEAGPLDLAAQETAYRAAIAAWSDVSWLRGIYWWDWPVDPRDAVGDAFTPRDRPAEAVIRATSEAGGDVEEGVLSQLPWPLFIVVAIWAVVAVGFLAVLRRRGRDDAPETTPAAEAAPPAADRRPPADPSALPPPIPLAAAPSAAPPPPTVPPAPDRFTRRRRDPIAGLGVVELDRLAGLVREALGVDLCAILMRVPGDTRHLTVTGQSGVALRGRRWPADAGVAGLVLSRVEPIAVKEYGALGARLADEQTTEVHAAAGAPLIVHRALRGALSVGTTDPDRRFGPGDLELLGALAGLVAAALAHPGGPEHEDSVRAQIEGLGAALDARDADARRRTAAVGSIAARIGDRLLPNDERTRAELVLAARLHDVGMLRVPATKLRPADRLSGAAAALVAEHPGWGCDLLSEIPGLQGVAAIVRFHQERWDGSGYPHQLAGARIPLASRILGASEAWAAMTAGSPQVPARSPEHAVEELRRAAGTDFDPTVIEVLAAISPTMPRPLPRAQDHRQSV